MKLNFTRLACLLSAVLLISSAQAQQNFFRDVAEPSGQNIQQKRVIIPEKYRTLQLDTEAMKSFLNLLPSESATLNRSSTPIISLPMPNGSLARFHVWESSVMEQKLTAGYAAIITATGQGIDDPTATIKISWTEFGFTAMIFSPITGQILIDPYSQQSIAHYISYYKADHKKTTKFQELAPIEYPESNQAARNPHQVLAGPCVGTQLRTYRIAIACTHEYAIAATGLATPTKAQTLAKVVTSLNRLNGVYETEASIRMVLVANDTAILFTTADTDPFTGNDDAGVLIVQSQTQIDSRIGSANYDIGHTFSTGTAGLAGLGVVCTNFKARGVTGTSTPYGDGYDIDYVAHELGHQFGANHSFNNANSCGTTASDQNGEPGSGVTIMGYAGVCNADNIAFNSIPYFHAVSFDKISTFSNSGAGNFCAAITATGNAAPVVSAGPDYIIPRATPFILTGTATDANGDALTYNWEQVDVGGPNGASTSPSGNAPLFRSFAPVTNATRHFPRLSDVIANTATLGERLPNYARNMKFRLTVRDNRAGGGGLCFDETSISVANTTAADTFMVTYPTAAGITWYVNDYQTITWKVNGTATAPINCAKVTIQLSTDGGNSYPVTLVANTDNDGSEEIQVPANLSSTARIRVMAIGNVFYDISNANFRIMNPPAPSFAFNTPAPVQVCSTVASTTLQTASLGSFTTSIVLSASLLPPGTSVSFNPASIAPGSSTVVTLNNANTLDPGTYAIRVTGTAGSVIKSRDMLFVIPATPDAPAALNSPAAEATGVSQLPSFDWWFAEGIASYTLEISTQSDFSSIAQTVSNITSLPHILTSPLNENTTYYWRVKSTNTCNTTGTAGSAIRFRTGISTCRMSSDIPKTISATGAPTVTSTITIPAGNGVTINDINIIGLAGSHTYVGDLTFSLRGPNNTTVTLINQECTGGYADFNLNLDDAAASVVSCPMTGGIIARPAGSLAAFNGINSAGTWTLTVRDNAADDGGELTGWGLNINGASATGCSYVATPMAITYTFTGTGNWNIAGNWSNNTIPPNPLPSGAQIVINHTVGGSCNLNVSQTIAAGAMLTVITGKNLIVPGTLTIQ